MGVTTGLDFIKSTAIGAGSALLPKPRLFAQAPASKKPPNVVTMIADDQRHDTVAALGNDHIRTPNLARLAKGGFSFRRAECMGSQNGAVCVPARAMLNTGRSMFHIRNGQ